MGWGYNDDIVHNTHKEILQNVTSGFIRGNIYLNTWQYISQGNMEFWNIVNSCNPIRDAKLRPRMQD